MINNLEEKILKVPSKNQMNVMKYDQISINKEGSPRILILGNSVTRHPPKEDIGWHGDWGMAASCMDNDYVHVLMRNILEEYPNAAFCITQGSTWEETMGQCDYEEYFPVAKEFQPDIILNTLEANIPVKTFDGEVFKREMRRLHQHLTPPGGKVKIIMASSICSVPVKDIAIEEYAKEKNGYYVYVGDIFAKDENLAIGLFEHEGVAHHPGDLGMKCLAERYAKVLKEIIPTL